MHNLWSIEKYKVATGRIIPRDVISDGAFCYQHWYYYHLYLNLVLNLVYTSYH